jgi:membrane protease YdiL (CAAX protease family)
MSIPQTNPSTRTFSLPVYLLIVFGLSWPFMIAYAIWNDNPTNSLILSSLAMVMVTVGSYICGRWIFRDGFKNMGWNWGKPWHYLASFGLALVIFAVPVLIENLTGMHIFPAGLAFWPILGGFLVKFIITTIPGFGEEFGWRAYMLPRLVQNYGPRKGVLVHGLIWWFWHLPAIVSIGVNTNEPGTPIWLTVVILMLITLVPSVMNAILFAFVWGASGSLAVVSVYHSLFDEVRDTLEDSIGFGPLVSLWEMAVTTILGGILLWKANWGALLSNRK